VDDRVDGDESSPIYKRANERLSHFNIGFIKLSVRVANPKEVVEYGECAGSGTLVCLNGQEGILTAAHVLEELPSQGEIGLLLAGNQPKIPTSLKFNANYCRRYVIPGARSKENGPDIAFMTLPPDILSLVKAKASVFNLDKRREQILARNFPTTHCLYCVTGIIAERTVPIKAPNPLQHAALLAGSFEPGGIVPLPDYAGMDLFCFSPQVDVGYTPPFSYQGVSGGGLWKLLVKNMGSDEQLVDCWLNGVAFYQSESANGARTITCHGPRSIYSSLSRTGGVT